MNFEIEDVEKNSKKKIRIKRQKLLTYVSIFFLIISCALTWVYYYLQGNTENPKQSEQTSVEPINIKKIQIIDENSNDRPIAVMIDNNIGDNKHAGLQDSYINYEIIVEGGLTRIMAIYKDKDVELIGPVRSSRHYFLDYSLEQDAIYTHYGWSPYAENNIKSLHVNNINGMVDSEPFTRDKNIPSPHNVFTSTNKIKSYAEKKNYSLTSNNWQLLNYSVDEVELLNPSSEENDSILANQISMDYSNSESRSYTYDSENKYYLRYSNGKEHIDKISNNQLHYKNIIIMKVANKTIDSEGRQDLDTVGMGEGYYITNGYAKPISWSKTTRTSKTKYIYKDGTEVIINDGNTFIQIIPISSNLVIE